MLPRLALALFALTCLAPAQEMRGATTHVYERVEDVELRLHVFAPDVERRPRPAVVFFFGGGWRGGSVTQFEDQARYLASRGVFGVVADYRVASRHGTSPYACVQDGKAAVRWLRTHAERLGVDPARIAAAGGSAGGHVAAAAALCRGFEPEGAPVSSVPDALVLFNPVFDNGPDGYGHERLGARWREISPLHNIRKGAPPTLVLLGSEDRLVPVATAERYRERMRAVGSRCDLRVFRGQAHGFFNKKRSEAMYAETVLAMDRFLASLGWLGGLPTLRLVQPELDVEALFREAVVVDGVVQYHSPESQVGRPHFERDEDGRSVKQATGIDLAPMTISAEDRLPRLTEYIQEKCTGCVLIRSRADLERAIEARQYGIVYYLQKHWKLGGSVRPLQRWYDAGLRILQLQYGRNDGNQGELERLGGGTGQRGGLTELGRSVMGECFRLGMLVDVSHCNEATTLEAARIAKARGVPITANHAGARGVLRRDGRWLARYARNMTDRELRAIRDTGGVVGVMAYGPYLRGPYQKLRTIPPTRGIPAASLEDFVAHVDYIAQRIGVAHVGFATDGYLDGTMAHEREADGVLDGPGRWKAAARRLYELGYSVEDLKKMLGANFLRVFREVWK